MRETLDNILVSLLILGFIVLLATLTLNMYNIAIISLLFVIFVWSAYMLIFG